MAIAALKGSFHLSMKATLRMFDLMQNKKTLNKHDKKNEKLLIENDEKTLRSELKELIRDDIEFKEIDKAVKISHQQNEANKESVIRIQEFIQPEIADKTEEVSEDEEDLIESERFEIRDKRECMNMLNKDVVASKENLQLISISRKNSDDEMENHQTDESQTVDKISEDDYISLDMSREDSEMTDEHCEMNTQWVMK
jgi:hypothetical protein